MKKALEKKALNVPDAVAMIIRAVYLEKSHTMKKMKKDHELACIGFRKWVIEQKKKTKKDPLPMARIEVSKVIISIPIILLINRVRLRQLVPNESPLISYFQLQL